MASPTWSGHLPISSEFKGESWSILDIAVRINLEPNLSHAHQALHTHYQHVLFDSICIISIKDKNKAMLILQNANHQIIIQNDDTYTPKSSDNKYTYEKEHFFGSEKHISSKYSLMVKTSGSIIHSCILLASGGVSGVHNNSAILYKDLCLVAVGPYLVALQLPVLEVDWFTEVDPATCFGIYYSAKYNCFISHGEIEICQIFYSGELGWQCSGKDIFSNGFDLFEDYIIAVDFNDERYRIDIGTGENRLLT